MAEITHTYDHIETYKTNTKRWFYFLNLMENGAVGAQDDPENYNLYTKTINV